MKTRLLLLCSLLLLAGCASKPSVPFDRARHADLDRILVLSMREAEVGHKLFNNPAASFGLIGATLAATDEAVKARALREMLPDLQVNAYFQSSLQAALEARGYTLLWAEPRLDSTSQRDFVSRDADGLRRNYTSIEGAPAQLDVGLQFVGYAASGLGKDSPYRPTVAASARLLGSDGSTVLFYDTLIYHNAIGSRRALTLEPDPAHAYPRFQDLREADPAELDASLRAAMDAITRLLAEQL